MSNVLQFIKDYCIKIFLFLCNNKWLVLYLLLTRLVYVFFNNTIKSSFFLYKKTLLLFVTENCSVVNHTDGMGFEGMSNDNSVVLEYILNPVFMSRFSSLFLFISYWFLWFLGYKSAVKTCPQFFNKMWIEIVNPIFLHKKVTLAISNYKKIVFAFLYLPIARINFLLNNKIWANNLFIIFIVLSIWLYKELHFTGGIFLVFSFLVEIIFINISLKYLGYGEFVIELKEKFGKDCLTNLGLKNSPSIPGIAKNVLKGVGAALGAYTAFGDHHLFDNVKDYYISRDTNKANVELAAMQLRADLLKQGHPLNTIRALIPLRSSTNLNSSDITTAV